MSWGFRPGALGTRCGRGGHPAHDPVSPRRPGNAGLQVAPRIAHQPVEGGFAPAPWERGLPARRTTADLPSPGRAGRPRSQTPRPLLLVNADEAEVAAGGGRKSGPDYGQGSACDLGSTEARAPAPWKPVIPAKAGIHFKQESLDPRLLLAFVGRTGNDGEKEIVPAEIRAQSGWTPGRFFVRRTIRKERCRRPDSDPIARKAACRHLRPDDLDAPIQALRRTKNGLGLDTAGAPARPALVYAARWPFRGGRPTEPTPEAYPP